MVTLEHLGIQVRADTVVYQATRVGRGIVVFLDTLENPVGRVYLVNLE